MLKKIRLTNFKSFLDEEVELAPLTFLVGANASGKSNFLDAIRFLQGLSRNLTLSEILNGEERVGADRWPGIRGRAEEAARFGTSAFSIETTWLAPALEIAPDGILRGVPNRVETRHRLACSLHQPAVLEEKVNWGPAGKLWLSASPHGQDKVRVQTSDRRSRTFSNQKSLVSDPVTRLALTSASDAQDFEALEDLNQVFSAIRFLEIQPSAMRNYGRRGAPLGNEGKNLSGVLATLSDEPTTKQSFVAWLREVCAPEIEDLDFAGVKELGDVMAIFVEKKGARISARSISDGTLRFLGTLLALQTAEAGEVLLIEEIEEGLHPTRIHFLLELLESAVRHRNIQVIATTHSPVVLQWLAPERLREILVFGRIPGRPGSLIRQLGEIHYFDEVIQRESIDELFSTGWLEMAL